MANYCFCNQDAIAKFMFKYKALISVSNCPKKNDGFNGKKNYSI